MVTCVNNPINVPEDVNLCDASAHTFVLCSVRVPWHLCEHVWSCLLIPQGVSTFIIPHLGVCIQPSGGCPGGQVSLCGIDVSSCSSL